MNCLEIAVATISVSERATMELTLECQLERNHHHDHASTLAHAADAFGTSLPLRATWPNLAHVHRACAECGSPGSAADVAA